MSARDKFCDWSLRDIDLEDVLLDRQLRHEEEERYRARDTYSVKPIITGELPKSVCCFVRGNEIPQCASYDANNVMRTA